MHGRRKLEAVDQQGRAGAALSADPGGHQEPGEVRVEAIAYLFERAVDRTGLMAGYPLATGQLAVHTAGDPLDMVPVIRELVRELDPSLAIYNVTTLEDRVLESVHGLRNQLWIVAGLAAIALLLAVVGVYAVTAHTVRARTFEIGVRKAVGAQQSSVVRLVLGQELIPIGLGTAAGLTAAWHIADVLSASLFQTSSRDPLVFVAAPLYLQ